MNAKKIAKTVLLIAIFILSIHTIYGAAPTLNAIATPQNLTESVQFNITVIATDPENGPLNFSDDTDNFNIVKINDTNAEIVFTPTNAMVGEFIAVIIVMDNESLVDAQAVNFIVNGIPSFDNLANKNVSAENEFYFDINATDPEDPITNLTFSDDSSLFDLNSSTGIINFTTNTSILGTYDITIVVNDSRSANSTGTFSLTINDQPNMTSMPGNITQEDQAFFINISDFVNDTVGNLTFSDNATFFNIDSTTGQINFTPTFNDTGNFTINITVEDDFGLKNSQIWSLNITLVNDVPVLPTIENQTSYNGLLFTLQLNATDEENDTLAYSDNSTFFDINTTTGLINFTINSSMIGSYIINITVNDTSGANTSDTFNFTILANSPPIFGKNFTTSINPNVDAYTDAEFPDTNYKGSEYLQISGADTVKRTYLNFSMSTIPSTAYIFLAQLNLTVNSNTPDTNITVFRITSNWSIDNITHNNQPTANSDLLSNSTSNENEGVDNFNITETVRKWQNASLENLGLSVRVTNETQEINSIKYYSADSSNSTKYPTLSLTYNKTIANQTITSGNNLTNAFDLDDYFLDPEDQTMSFNVTQPGNTSINVTINTNNTVDFFTSSAYTGSKTITFNATDGANVTISNVVTIIVNAAGSTTTTTTTTTTSSGGSGTSKTKTAALSITTEQRRAGVKEGETIEIPLILKNTGEVDLSKVTVTTKIDKTGLKINLKPEKVGALSVNEQATLSVIIDTSEATEENYIITLQADVSNPVLSESTVIILDVITEAANIKKQLDFAVDFFKNNPRCLELQELINKAQIQLKEKDYNEASSNIAIAIESCQNLLREEEPRLTKGRFSLLVNILIFLAIATIVIIALYIGLKKFLPTKKKERKIGKKWF